MMVRYVVPCRACRHTIVNLRAANEHFLARTPQRQPTVDLKTESNIHLGHRPFRCDHLQNALKTVRPRTTH